MEENKTPNKSEKEIIKENMLILYKTYQDGEKNTVDEISYYKQIVLQSKKSPIMYGLQDIYPVNIKEPEKFYGNRVLLYQNGTPIAMIDENSNIKFSNEYLEQMKPLNPSIYALLHSMNGKHYELPQIQEVSGKLPDINSKQEVEDFKLSKEELENAKLSNPRNAVKVQGDITPGEPVDLKISLVDFDLKFSQLAQITSAQATVTDNNTREIEKVTFTKQGDNLVSPTPPPYWADVYNAPYTFQVSTWLNTTIKAYYTDADKKNFKGRHGIMGFIYPAKDYEDYARAIGIKDTFNDNTILWNLFPVFKEELSAIATVYCYFDRTDNRFDENNVDKYLAHKVKDISSIRNMQKEGDVYDGTKQDPTGDAYRAHLNDPALGYSNVW